jgi:threonine/homoserine/homoserine lactone efflux protein
VYDRIRFAGAAYLVALGAVPLFAPLLRRTRPVGPAVPTAGRDGPGPAFATGLLSDLLNPRIGMFYVAGVPEFVPPGRDVLGWTLLLSGVDVALAMAWFAVLAWAASAAVAGLRRPAVGVWSQRVAGASLMGRRRGRRGRRVSRLRSGVLAGRLARAARLHAHGLAGHLRGVKPVSAVQSARSADRR